MIVGILCESNDDFEIFSVLVKKILEGVATINRFIPYETLGGPITGKLEAASFRFFNPIMDDNEVADFAIYFTDVDNSRDKKVTIQTWNQEHSREHPDRHIVIAFAEPHFEQWFFDETDSLVHVLKLPTPVPYGDMPAKGRLKRIIREYGEFTLTNTMIRTQLADRVVINSLRLRSTDFNTFCNDLISVVRRVGNA